MMRGLYSQFLLPAAALLGSLLIGAWVDSIVWGSIIGAVLACVLAGVFGRHAAKRLETVERIARRADSVDIENLAMSPSHDAIDDALQTVAQRTIDDNCRIEHLSMLLTQQAHVLDRMNDGLMRVREDGQVIYANVAAGSLFGGRNPTERTFMSVTRDHELVRSVRDCLETGVEQQHTSEIAGEGRLINAVSIRLSEHPAEALVMLRDITEVNRLQNLRRDFVSNVSHELRTPLSTIKILAETLLDIRADDDAAVDFLRKIDGEVDSMTALVSDLLDLTRLETFGGKQVLRQIAVGMLIQDVVDRMRPLAERHDVSLHQQIDDGAGTVVGDERRLHQALINLITNAIVHTSSGQVVTVGVGPCEGGVRFFVRDTGIGIAPEDLPRIWERFYKTDKARTSAGTGLGLAIAKHIVLAHAGTVTATSELGKGSEFSFVIPNDSESGATLSPDTPTTFAPH